MYCSRCGKQIADEAVVCIGCGCPVQPVKPVSTFTMTTGDDKWTSGAMTGLVIGSIFVPLLGIILGVIYLSNSSTSPERKKQAMTLLIVAGAVMAFWFVLYIGIMIFAAALS